MEKWKLVFIILLLSGVVGYGFYQQNTASPLPDVEATPQPSEDPAKSFLLGKPAPAWNIPAGSWMNTPQPISLEDVKGHITLLEFFRIECPHCRQAVPFMHSLYSKYQPQGLKIVTFQSPGKAPAENDWSTVQATVRRWSIPYPVAFDKNSALFKGKYNGKAFPTVFVLDEKGIIRFRLIGLHNGRSQALENVIVKALALRNRAVKK
jgi:thiol-disulfide isomerase/thioredoxin